MKLFTMQKVFLFIVCLLLGSCGGTTATTSTSSSSLSYTIVPTDGQEDVAINTSIAITFPVAMNSTTITMDTDGSCSGSVQVSNDDFVSCVSFVGSPTASSGNTVFTLVLSTSLLNSTLYTVKLTTAISDNEGTSLDEEGNTSFTTIALTLGGAGEDAPAEEEEEAEEENNETTYIYYLDTDGDGYGDPATATTSTEAIPPSGYVVDATDCDDTVANINPGTSESCDGIDNNCDGTVDEGVTGPYYQDLDGDGYGNAAVANEQCAAGGGYVASNTDCDDAAVAVNPGATEVCDGTDNNCDEVVDEGVTAPFYQDSDGDGYGDSGSTKQLCVAGGGYIADNTDCDDTDAAINPAATEICDGIDNNCVGGVDEGVSATYYADDDGDGFGDPDDVVTTCPAPADYVENSADCDDADASIPLEVDQAGGGDYTVIQDAIDNASAGDCIVVQDATYNENLSFDGLSDIELYGANGYENVIVSSSLADTPVISVINSASEIEINGLTIQDGSGTGGSGILIEDSSNISIENNYITNNYSDFSKGGGISIESSSNVAINDNTFYNNTAFYSGGGVSVWSSGASGSITVEDNVFQENIVMAAASEKGGGGLAIQSSTNTGISNNVFVENRAAQGGGMFVFEQNDATNIIHNNVFQNNIADQGSAIMTEDTYYFYVFNNAFIANGTTSWGSYNNESVLYLNDDAGYILQITAYVANNVFLFNDGGGKGSIWRDGTYLAIAGDFNIGNNIIANNFDCGVFLSSVHAQLFFDYNLFYNNGDPLDNFCGSAAYAGNNLLSEEDPLFDNLDLVTDADANDVPDVLEDDDYTDDFSLNASSPALGAGSDDIDSSGAVDDIDQDGTPEDWDYDNDGNVDIGIYDGVYGGGWH